MAFYIDGQEILTLNIDGVKIETLNIDGVTVARKPTITTQPAGGTINDTQTKALSVVADGLGSTMTYQWYKSDGTAISGATGTSYTFDPTSTGSFGFYCRVSGFGGYTDTDTVTVVVEASIVAPTITTDPVGGTITQFENYTASIVVDWGGETGTIVWFLDDTAQESSNSTSFTFVLPSVGTHTIRAEATNSKGTDVSSNATLTVNEGVSILTPEEYIEVGTLAGDITHRGYDNSDFGSLTFKMNVVDGQDGDRCSLARLDAADASSTQTFKEDYINFVLLADLDVYTHASITLDGVTAEFDFVGEPTFVFANYQYKFSRHTTDDPEATKIFDKLWGGVGAEMAVKVIMS
ncbi:hypothetical protein AL471_014335 [Vibrio alginolyticus]|uniref:hypothetical protein n=1 Tax=Vibrio alginolyticus TaxID=663 RepID=UPI00076C26FA|nr:hypothetical protein [Vibrio alginolyticus]PNP21950.1 hypothetical protein AL471_014335 [Vibrio alginolyticus]